MSPFFYVFFLLLLNKETVKFSINLGGVIILTDLELCNGDSLQAKEPMIRRLGQDDLSVAAQVIRESFTTVANEFGLTSENCPTNGAFTQSKHLKVDLEKGCFLFGVYLGMKMIGFFELVYKENHATLEKVAILPAERGNKYGKFILDKAQEIARNDHIKQIDIGIIKENTRLKRWYQKNGYQIVRSEKYTHLPFVVLFMQLNLNDEVTDE